jgi:hypothetical protein
VSADAVPPVPQVPAVPVENVRRGALLALATIPLGVVVWVVLWGFGFIASLVAAGVAILALRLYVWGAGQLSRRGAVVVVAITVATLLLAFFAGIVLDAAMAFGDLSGLGAWGAFVHEDFWPAFWEVMPDAMPEYLPDFGWALAFGALGSYATLRAVFTATRPVATVAASTAPETSASPDAV